MSSSELRSVGSVLLGSPGALPTRLSGGKPGSPQAQVFIGPIAPNRWAQEPCISPDRDRRSHAENPEQSHIEHKQGPRIHGTYQLCELLAPTLVLDFFHNEVRL